MRLNSPPDTLTARSLDVPLGLPITTWVGDDFKRFLAAGVPVTPVNLALRSRFEGHAGRASLRSYEYAVGLFLTFMAKRNLSLLAVSDSDFDAFVRALTGRAYADADGRPTVLPGQRGEVTANNIVSRLYGLFGDIGSAYGIEFEWRRFRRLARRGRWGDPAVQGPRIRREHGYRTPIKEPRGIPDEQLAKGLVHAQKIWGAEVADGDRAYAPDRETQGGALLWRNLAILFALRFAGARRAEVGPINLTDIDRERGDISLVTKGRHGARERVVLVPTLANAIAKYLFEFRPLVAISKRDGEPQSIDRQAVFVSHSVANYGRR